MYIYYLLEAIGEKILIHFYILLSFPSRAFVRGSSTTALSSLTLSSTPTEQ